MSNHSRPPTPPLSQAAQADPAGLIAIEQIGDWQFWRFDQLESTSKTAKDLFASDQLTLPAIIFTRLQTAGYGRQGRNWHQQGAGNLAISFALSTDDHQPESGTLAMLSSLAVMDALAAMLGDSITGQAVPPPHPILQLKWPNDVLIDGKKGAGILVEPMVMSRPLGQPASHAVVIGVGINLISHPGDLGHHSGQGFAATDLATATGLLSIPPATAAAYLTDALTLLWHEWQTQQQAAQGAMRQRWLSHGWGLGQPVTLVQGASSINGVFETVADDGRLQLRLADGR
ncbi:MAG: biotin--[acetyl-CoA-carboxylase] ligase, partial [Alphaproteobacteria bacterium]|nr:biotin--[acetyl-CoA-carboxylase] ligase [Alphaproteobacteria bacterium]